jgi:iron complex outermembrane receptor protein
MGLRQKSLGAASALALLAAGSGAASAQDAPNEGDNAQARAGVDMIVVTARKREETLQDVPVSISAFSGSDLDDAQITNVRDLRFFTPNLYIEPALGLETTTSIYIRGLGQINPSFFFDAPAPIYMDGVYIARAFGSLTDLYDVERVEVLRGPQGTLFGRNASAGAIQIVSKKPPLEDFDLSVEASYGTEGQRNFNTMIGAPLVEGKVGFRAALTYRRNDGFMTETTTGHKAFEDNIFAGRASLLFAPDETTEIILRGDFLRDRSDPPGASAFNPDPDGDPYTFVSNFSDDEGFSDTDSYTGSLTINKQLPDATVTSITAYRAVENFGRADGDGKAFPPLVFENLGQGLDQWQFTQEVYVNGSHFGSLPVNWTTGVFYLHEDNKTNFSISILPFIPVTRQLFDQQTDAIGAYLELTYPVGDRLELSGGARYTWDSKDFQGRQEFADGTPNPAFDFADNTTVYRWTWNASAKFEVNEDFNFYVRSGTGFRAGNFNGNAFNRAAITSGALKTESVFDIEGGFKSEWFDNRLRLNAAYFYEEFENLQLEVLTPSGVTNLNLNVEVNGLEVEILAEPFEGFNLFGNVGTLNNNIPNTPGTELPRAAKYTYQVGFNYHIPLPSNAGRFRIGANYGYTDDYLNGRPDDLARIVPGFGLLDASATYEAPNGKWAFTITGANLTDKFYQVSSFNIPGLVTVQTPNRPRTWLATIRWNY